MKLLFWKPKPTQSSSKPTEIKSKEEYIRDHLSGGPIVNQSNQSTDDTTAAREGNDSISQERQSRPISATSSERIGKLKEQPLDRRRYKMLAIKNWCERKLTPVAYARVLVRILPVLREYGYNFREMQHPTERTLINRDFFLVISATIKEIYKEEYQRQEPAQA